MIHQRRYLPNRRPRRGTLYVAVLGVSMIVAICGLSGIQIARLKLKAVQGAMDSQRARVLALSAIDHAVSMTDANPTWRVDLLSNDVTSPWSLGDETFMWKLVDEDGNLADDSSDPVWVYGIGRVGNAEWIERARARVDAGLPLEFLRTALHASRTLTIKSGKVITPVNAPISTDGRLDNDGTISGDAESVALVGSGVISGTSTVGVERKGIPSPDVFEDYVMRATAIPFNGDIDRVVMGAEVNGYGGGLNVDGAYFIDTAGADIEISRSRILGTLVIDTGGGTVELGTQCLIQPYRDDFPTLIVKGAVEFGTNPDVVLREAVAGNMNPAGMHYAGVSDSDTTDTYPSELHGLVHVMGNVEISGDIRLHGCLVVQGAVEVTADPTIIHDRSLMFNPPRGYTSDPDNTGMIIEPQSWSRHAGL